MKTSSSSVTTEKLRDLVEKVKPPRIPKLSRRPTETVLWKRIRPLFNDGYDRAYRIEAVNTPGFPDVVWCPYLRGPIFIELKAGPMRIRPQQKNFIEDMHRCGISVWVLWQPQAKQEPIVFRGEWLLSNWPLGKKIKGGEVMQDWMARMKGYE